MHPINAQRKFRHHSLPVVFDDTPHRNDANLAARSDSVPKITTLPPGSFIVMEYLYRGGKLPV